MATEHVRDSMGSVVGIIEDSGYKKEVYDAVGNMIGYTEGGKTYRTDGHLIAYSENPYILFKGLDVAK